MATATGHVVTSTVFLNVLSALWALFHLDTHDLLNVQIYCWSTASLFRVPLMFTNETHDGLKAQTAQTPTTWLRALHLQRRWIERVSSKLAAPYDHWKIKGLNSH
jgi:hypothetical protein